MHYFGVDPDSALEKYLNQKDALHAGRKPRAGADAFTVKELANAFLNAKAASRDSGEIAPRTWEDYKAACDILIDNLGKRRLVADIGPDDFAALRKKLAKKWGPRTLANVTPRASTPKASTWPPPTCCGISACRNLRARTSWPNSGAGFAPAVPRCALSIRSIWLCLPGKGSFFDPPRLASCSANSRAMPFY